MLTLGQPATPAQVDRDPLEESVMVSVEGVRGLRERVAELEGRCSRLEYDNFVLESEAAALRRQVEAERTERAYYHRFAIGVATSLNLVGQVCDEVMSKAQREAMAAMPFGSTPPESPIPPLEIPRFLKAGPRRDDETGGA